MNKELLLGVIIAMLTIASVPVLAQDNTGNTDDDAQLAELLKNLSETDQVANNQPTPEPEEVDTGQVANSQPNPQPEEAPEPMPMPEAEKVDGEEHEAAEDILNLLGGSFEYAGPEVIEVPVSTIEDTSVVIRTSKILYDGNAIQQYRVYFSTNTIADFLDVNDLKEMDLDIENTMGDIVELSLDGLTPSTTYYLIVAPVDPTDPEADPLELISEEVSFQTKATVPVPTGPAPTQANESGPAANGMYVDDVTYTYADNKATVLWTAKQEAQTVALSIKKPNSTTYTKLADVPATAGKYTFTVQEGGLHLLKVETKNANGEVFGKEQIQSIKIDNVEMPAEPVVSAPQVGPAQDLLIALIFAALIAGVGYNFRKQEI